MRRFEAIRFLIVAMLSLTVVSSPDALQIGEAILGQHRLYPVSADGNRIAFGSKSLAKTIDWETLAREHFRAVDIADLNEEDIDEMDKRFSEFSFTGTGYREFVAPVPDGLLKEYYYFIGRRGIIRVVKFELWGTVRYRLESKDGDPSRLLPFIGYPTAELPEEHKDLGGALLESTTPLVFSVNQVTQRYDEGVGGWRLFPRIEDRHVTWVLNDGGEGRWTLPVTMEYLPSKMDFFAYVFTLDSVPDRRFLFLDKPDGYCDRDYNLIEISQELAPMTESFSGCSPD